MTLHVLAYHAFEPPPNSAGGEPIHYSTLVRLLGAVRWSFTPTPHDLYDLAASRETALRWCATLDERSVVVSTLGPYAYFYCYLRELNGGRFRIVRDIRTTSASPSLLQEQLCAPFTRPGDLVVFPSEFARQYYLRLFPASLSDENTAVAYPLQESLAKQTSRNEGSGRHIGYLGRVSKDKNIEHAVECFAALAQRDPNTRFSIAGPIYPPQHGLASVADLKRIFRLYNVPPGRIAYRGVLDHELIWRYLAELDVLYFPSLSSNESFGRVIAEATHAGVAVVAADYGAATELLQPDSIVTTRYRTGTRHELDEPFSFGVPDLDSAIKRLEAARFFEDVSTRDHLSSDAFVDLMISGRRPAAVPKLSNQTEAFLRSVRIDGLNSVTRLEAMALIGDAFRWFGFYGAKAFSRRLRGVMAVARTALRRPSSRRGLRERLLRPDQRAALRHAAVVCDFLSFHPTITLAPSTEADIVILTGRSRQSTV